MSKLNILYIKKRRNKLNLSQTTVAKELGLTSEKYCRRENGEYKFKSEELPVLSKVLKVPIEKFFT